MYVYHPRQLLNISPHSSPFIAGAVFLYLGEHLHHVPCSARELGEEGVGEATSWDIIRLHEVL